MIEAKNNGGADFEPVPAGTYPARCYSMVHIGTIVEQFKGESKTINKVRLSWELPTELKVFKEENGEQPMVISKDYTLSMHEKSNLRKDLESWRGKGFTEEESEVFDITNLLGVECQISIIHKKTKAGKTYANISAISTLMKGTSCPEQVNKTFEFNYNQPFMQDEFDSLPDWLKDKMKTSQEYKAIFNPQDKDLTDDSGTSTNDPEDDLPF